MNGQNSEHVNEISMDVLVDFFRNIINEGFGYGGAMEADPQSVLTEFISPGWNRDYVVPRFLQSILFG